MKALAVIGGGASGMICAITALRRGLSVVLIEQMDRVGKKLLATGNGRCNLANRQFDLSHYHGSCVQAAAKVFESYGTEEIEAFWEGLGILYTEEEDGKCYPRSLQASSVLNVLRRELSSYEKRGRLQLLTGAKVKDLRPVKDSSGTLEGWSLLLQIRNEEGILEERLSASQVVLATGGKASPKLGSDGSGYRLAEKLGGKVSFLRPGICRLLSEEPCVRRLAGQKVTGWVRLLADEEEITSIREELLFTAEGVSGPAVLSLSRPAGDALEEDKQVYLTVDLAEEYTEGRLFAFLMKRSEIFEDLSLEEMLEGFIPKRMIPEVLNQASLDRTETGRHVDKRQMGALAKGLKAFRIPISRLDTFRDAQVTVGGVLGSSLGEGLEAKKAPGIYYAGELLDLDGDCGGYNLMFAAASGLWIGNRVKDQ